MSHASATLSPTQRRITLVRHAKAVPMGRDADRDRALAAEGQASARALGDWLREQTLEPQLVLCSPATRTRETWELLQLTAPVQLNEALYLSSAADMLALLQGCDDAVHHAMVVGHNPGIHALAATLAGDYVREADADQLASRYPTAGLVSMSVSGPWASLAAHSATVDLLRFSTAD